MVYIESKMVEKHKVMRRITNNDLATCHVVGDHRKEVGEPMVEGPPEAPLFVTIPFGVRQSLQLFQKLQTLLLRSRSLLNVKVPSQVSTISLEAKLWDPSLFRKTFQLDLFFVYTKKIHNFIIYTIFKTIIIYNL